MNDEYARDISQKVRSVLDSKKGQGKFIGSYAPYGYLRDPKDKYKFIIDKEPAKIVKKIFSMILSGKSKKEIANELLAESNIKSENKVKGKVENFFIEAKGKFKSGLNKFKVNLNDKEHVKSRKKIEILQVLLTIILLPFAFAIVCSTIGVGIGLIGSLIALVIGTPFAISLTNVMPEIKILIIFLFIAYIGFEILIWQLFIAVVRLEKKSFKIYITWIKTNQLYIDGSIKKEEIERHDETIIKDKDGGELDE